MTTTVVYATSSDFEIESNSGGGDWAAAADGTATLTQNNVGLSVRIGWRRQVAGRYAYEMFIPFDTSSIGTDIVSSAEVSVSYWAQVNNGGAAHNIRSYFYGTTYSTSGGTDFVSRSGFGGLTLMGSRINTDFTTQYTFYAITESAPGEINGAGNSVIVLASDVHINLAADKTTNDYVDVLTQDNSYPAYLTIQHTSAANVAMFGCNF